MTLGEFSQLNLKRAQCDYDLRHVVKSAITSVGDWLG